MKKILYGVLALGPVLAFAQSYTTIFGSLTGFLGALRSFLSNVIPVLIAIAVIYFLWGLVQFVRSAGDEKAREIGKQHMLWGIVAIVVMFSIWGIIGFLVSATGIQTGGGSIPTPTL